MRALRTKLTAVVLMGIAGAGLSTATATADGQATTDMIGGLPNLIGYCQGLGYSTAKPLDPGDAYSWACVDESTGAVGAIDMNHACSWHHPAYSGVWGSPQRNDDAFSWRCYA